MKRIFRIFVASYNWITKSGSFKIAQRALKINLQLFLPLALTATWTLSFERCNSLHSKCTLRLMYHRLSIIPSRVFLNEFCQTSWNVKFARRKGAEVKGENHEIEKYPPKTSWRFSYLKNKTSFKIKLMRHSTMHVREKITHHPTNITPYEMHALPRFPRPC